VTDRRVKEADQAYEIRALGVLQEMSTEALYAEDMTTLLNRILDKWIKLHRSDFGNIQVYDPEAQVLRIAAQRNFQPRFLEHFAEVSVREPCACGLALRNGERVIIEDVERVPAYALSLAEAQAAGYRAVQSTPLLTREHKPLGMISTHFREPRHFADLEMRFTDLAARQSADAIRTQLLRDALESRNETLEAREKRMRLATPLAGNVFLQPEPAEPTR
jgi:GAF domain-containing protein